MPDSFVFSTGEAALPDIGEMSYNGCTFSPLFASKVAGKVIQDDANWTTKCVEYTITIDGIVTPPPNDDTENSLLPVMVQLRRLLLAQGGPLIYEGRGNPISVNTGNSFRDVAWGPIPRILDFQPLGAGRSAMITFEIVTRIYEEDAGGGYPAYLQFNYESSVGYDDSGYATWELRGTIEVPMTRTTPDDRQLPNTVESVRGYLGELVDKFLDLTRFRMVKRDFQTSRDRRTLNFVFQAEELPPQKLPPYVPVARGNFSFRPSQAGPGFASWLCTLRCTYTVRRDKPRRTAWIAFLTLLRWRMAHSVLGILPDGNNNQNQPNGIPNFALNFAAGLALGPFALAPLLQNQAPNKDRRVANNARKCFLVDLSGEEGLYLDSKTVTFSATWKLMTTFSNILAASGLWRYVDEDPGNTWATSVRDVMGPFGYASCLLDPNSEAIVDFGAEL